MAYINKDVTVLYRGYLMSGNYEKASHLLFLVDTDQTEIGQPLASRIHEQMKWDERALTVFYHITDKPYSEDELTEMLITKLCGAPLVGDGDVEVHHHYSEMTGYLYTDERLKIGGHDLMKELRSYMGKWCFLSVTVHDLPVWVSDPTD